MENWRLIGESFVESLVIAGKVLAPDAYGEMVGGRMLLPGMDTDSPAFLYENSMYFPHARDGEGEWGHYQVTAEYAKGIDIGAGGAGVVAWNTKGNEYAEPNAYIEQFFDFNVSVLGCSATFFASPDGEWIGVAGSAPWMQKGLSKLRVGASGVITYYDRLGDDDDK